MDLVAGAGLNTYRFSLEWSRIEPAEGEFSRAALDHYRRMVDGARERGLNPLVTLVHFTMPRWLMHDGGWTGPKTGDRLARFAEFAAPALADAEYVATINEPNLMAAQPVLGGMAMRGEPIHGLPRPDQGVADALLGAARPGPRGVPRRRPAHGHDADRPREHRRGRRRGAHAGGARGVRGPVPRRPPTATTGSACRSTRARASAPTAWSRRRRSCRPWRTAWSAVPRPSARRSRYAAEVLPGVPLLVTENGIATADDEDRIRVHRRRPARPVRRDRRRRRRPRLRALEPARQLRVDARLRPTFGLVSVDRETFVRTPKPSLAWLGEVARRNGL